MTPAQCIHKGPTVCGFWLPRCLSGKESACQCRRYERRGFYPWARKIPWRRKWQPTAVFLPGEAHGQRGLVGYTHKASDMTEHKRTVCGFSYLISSPGSFSAKYDSVFGIAFVRDGFSTHPLAFAHQLRVPHFQASVWASKRRAGATVRPAVRLGDKVLPPPAFTHRQVGPLIMLSCSF